MKALKINSPIALNTGNLIPSGAILVIAEAFVNVRKKEIKDGIEVLPCQVITDVYVSLAEYEKGASPVFPDSIKDFNPAFYKLYLSVEGYETLPVEPLLIEVAYDALELVYPDKVQEITI